MPLLIWSPSFKGNQKITSSTNHVDLPPTILGLAGLNDNLSEYIGENIFCKDNNSYSIIHTFSKLPNTWSAVKINMVFLKYSSFSIFLINSLLGIPPMDNIPKLGFGLETIAGSGNLAYFFNKFA